MVAKNHIIYRRKLMRVGGSVSVPIPRELRQALGIGTGEYVTLVAVNEHSILLKKERKVWDGRIKKKD